MVSFDFVEKSQQKEEFVGRGLRTAGISGRLQGLGTFYNSLVPGKSGNSIIEIIYIPYLQLYSYLPNLSPSVCLSVCLSV